MEITNDTEFMNALAGLLISIFMCYSLDSAFHFQYLIKGYKMQIDLSLLSEFGVMVILAFITVLTIPIIMKSLKITIKQ